MTIAVFATGWPNWEYVLCGNGSTTLKAASTGRKVLLKNIIFSTKNACNLYLCDTDGTRLSGTIYLAANGAWSSVGEKLNVVTAVSKGLKIWTSADPETYAQIDTDYIAE